MAERRSLGLFRLPMVENFEERQLMAADVQFAEPVTQSLAATAVLTCVPVSATEQVSETTQSLDVNEDGRISNLDFLAVLNQLSQRSILPLEGASTSSSVPTSMEGETSPATNSIDSLEKMDVNSDGQISPLDVLLIVNRIEFYNPLTPCTCAACLGANPGIKCESATVAPQAEMAPVELAPQWQPQ